MEGRLSQALDLLREVTRNFTRDDDLPDELLPRIDKLLGEDVAEPEMVTPYISQGQFDRVFPPVKPGVGQALAQSAAGTLLGPHLDYTRKMLGGWGRKELSSIAGGVKAGKTTAAMPDCWVVVRDGRIIGTSDEPAHLDGIEAVKYVPAKFNLTVVIVGGPLAATLDLPAVAKDAGWDGVSPVNIIVSGGY